MITSKTNPKIKNLVRLQKASERREQNRILIEGRREIERAQQCGFEMEELYVCESLLHAPVNIGAKYIETVSEEVFDKIAYREGSDGLLAVAKPKYKSLTLGSGRWPDVCWWLDCDLCARWRVHGFGSLYVERLGILLYLQVQPTGGQVQEVC